MSIQNKTAFITGGSKGIGYGCAVVLIKAGMNVVLTSRTLEDAEAAATQLNTIRQDSALGLRADVRDRSALSIAVANAQNFFGSIDLVIANAGLGVFGSIETLTNDQWDTTIDTNLTGVFNTIKATLEPLKTSKGYFISIASLAGTNFFAGGSAYNASKFGVVGFTQAIMLDLRQYGIKVTTIMPGSVTSHFNNHEPNESDHWKIQPEDIGQMILDLMRMPANTLPSKIEVRPTMPA
ncbi:MAG: SDR family oxidoreductase [Schleiferiaceae bacterium]|nr:SDR family oxidoreductase [Schleiferiaceae bacterium]